MRSLSIGSPAIDEKGRQYIAINPLPAKYCNYDCIYCPYGPTEVKSIKHFNFEGTSELLARLEKTIENDEGIEVVFIDARGEAAANDKLGDILYTVKSHNRKLRVVSNGYLLNHPDYKSTYQMCDEVIGEIAATDENDFLKVCRPLEGHTLAGLVKNLADFRADYAGHFILSIIAIKGFMDTDEKLARLMGIIGAISPDEIRIETKKKGRGKKKYGLDEAELTLIHDTLERSAHEVLIV